MTKRKWFSKLKRLCFPSSKDNSGDRAGTTTLDKGTSDRLNLEHSEAKLPYSPLPLPTLDAHQIAASDVSSALHGLAKSQTGDQSSSLKPETLPSGASADNVGTMIVADEDLSPDATRSSEIQQPSVCSTPNNVAAESMYLPVREPTDTDDPLDCRPLTPKIAYRANSFDSDRTLELPDHGQPRTDLQVLPTVRTSLGLDPGSYGPLSRRYQNSTNIPQPSLDETPKLPGIFPLTISTKRHVCFNTNRPLQRLPTNAISENVQPALDDEAWSHRTDVIDLPDQEIEWYRQDAYQILEPKQHTREITDFLADVPKDSLYIRHGSFTVAGPPELRQILKYARFADVNELAQKAIHAICGFISEHQFERFHLDIFWEYSTLQLPVPQESTEHSFHDIIRKGLQSKLVTNFRGQEYIPRCDLAKFQQTSVIKNIISEDNSINDRDRDGVFGLAVSRATHLLLMCVYIERPIKMFKHLVEIHNIDDGRLESLVGRGYPPRAHEVCQQDECWDAINKIYKCAPEFLPLKLGKDPRFMVWKKDMVIPLHFFDKNRPLVTAYESSDNRIIEAREIGKGANGLVLAVWAEPSLHSLPGSLRQTFALKKASNIKPKAFESERIMLAKLYDYPHGHITPHYGSWQQDDHNYILLPRARCNLRHYLTAAQPPRLKTTAVKWFFDQLYGLADAIKHVHHIKPAGTLMNPEPADLNFAYHHDIKPENILVFEKVANAHPVLQIADFGAGSLYDAEAHKVSRPVDTVRGTRTYFAPAGEEATRPVDMWSLGCCFLELTLWLFAELGTEHNQDQFTYERKYFPGHNQNDTDDGFWYRRRDGKIEVKEPVIKRIETLRALHCRDMEVFQILLNVIRRPDGQKSLLTIDKATRMKDETLVDCLNSIRKHIDLQMRTVSVEDDLYARYFARNVSGSERALTPIIPLKLRTTLTTYNDPSSPRGSFEEDEPTTPVPPPLEPCGRHLSTSSLVLEAGQGTEYHLEAEESSLAINGGKGGATSQTLASSEDTIEEDLERLKREN